jgi:two-component system response regulator ResD
MSVKTALVVDDNDGIRERLRIFLELDGYVVDQADNGKSALERVKVLHFDLILVDYHMPDMKGDEVIKIFRFFCPNTILIGMSLEDKARDFIGAGADAFIVKKRLIMDMRPYVSLLDSQADDDRNAGLTQHTS